MAEGRHHGRSAHHAIPRWRRRGAGSVEFLAFDIQASIAHVEGLQRIDVLSADEAMALVRELHVLAEDFASGQFILDDRYEDGHSAIEARLTERLGDIGRKVHTGRSRNDQILVATRLWLKARLRELVKLRCSESARACLDRASNEALPLPGLHATCNARSYQAPRCGLPVSRKVSSTMPCARARRTTGSMPIPSAPPPVTASTCRSIATTRLRRSASRACRSSVYAQLSRGKFEIAALDALGAALLDLRRLAWDLSLFTTAEFGFVELPDHYTTGSSIMPNKRNPDVIELLRASYACVAAARVEIESLLSLPSGYQRDLQYSKGSSFPRVSGAGLGALASLLPDLLREPQLANRICMRRRDRLRRCSTIDQQIEQCPRRDSVPRRLSRGGIRSRFVDGRRSRNQPCRAHVARRRSRSAPRYIAGAAGRTRDLKPVDAHGRCRREAGTPCPGAGLRPCRLEVRPSVATPARCAQACGRTIRRRIRFQIPDRVGSLRLFTPSRRSSQFVAAMADARRPPWCSCRHSAVLEFVEVAARRHNCAIT